MSPRRAKEVLVAISDFLVETLNNGITSFSQGQARRRMISATGSPSPDCIGRLIEMTTGQKLSPVGDDQRVIQVNKERGEVTVKFKLPGFRAVGA